MKDKFKTQDNIKVENSQISLIEGKFNTILYLHVLEHIQDDFQELKDAIEKLESNGYLVIMAPAHQNILWKFRQGCRSL